MITILNGNLLVANQIAEELGRRYFGAKFYHWHGGNIDFSYIPGKYNSRDITIKGALIRNCNDADNLEILVKQLSTEKEIEADKFNVLITTSVPVEEPELNKLTTTHKFTLITVANYG